MISPQNLAVGTSATGLQGREGDLLRLVLKWSIGLVLVMSILVLLQAYVFTFFIPGRRRPPRNDSTLQGYWPSTKRAFGFQLVRFG